MEQRRTMALADGNMRGVYPWNVAYDALGEGTEVFKVWIPGLLSAARYLSDRERNAIRLRYRSRLPLDAVGAELGVSRERARQIILKALRKLVARRYMFYGDGAWDAGDLTGEIQSLKAENAALKKRLRMAMRALGVPAREQDDALDMALLETAEEPQGKDVGLDELGLSVRSYNCLKRAGYEKLSDFKDVSAEELSRARNLGRKSLEEVVHRLAEHGVKIL